ncbi:MAG: polymer-forming cytoskeletal protein [Candidatus Acidiferrales bacterium]
MWRSKQAPSASSTFSPALISTATIEPATAPKPGLSAGTLERTSPNSRIDSGVKKNISGNEDLRLEGSLEGPISVRCHSLTVGPAAKATAEVVAQEVIVFGELIGNLHAANRIEIKKNGSVVGDLTTPRITIEDGAYFKGKVQIERRRTPRGEPFRAQAASTSATPESLMTT